MPKAAHVAVAYDSKMLVFGGINKLGYVGATLYALELDTELSLDCATKESDRHHASSDASPSTCSSSE
jgi:hypothetical protein